MFTPSSFLSSMSDNRTTIQEGHHVTLNYADPNLVVDYEACTDAQLHGHLQDALVQYLHIYGWLKQFDHPESIRLTMINMEQIERQFEAMNQSRDGDIFRICVRVPATIAEVKAFLKH